LVLFGFATTKEPRQVQLVLAIIPFDFSTVPDILVQNSAMNYTNVNTA